MFDILCKMSFITYKMRQGQEHFTASDNTFFLEVIRGKNKKGYVYGFWHMGDEFVASLTLCTQFEPCPTLEFREVIHNLNNELA